MGLTILIVVLVILALTMIVVAFLSTRNTLIRQRNELGRAWAALDQLLKQRRDELPRLLGTCRSYLSDSPALEAVTAARNAEQMATALPEKARASSELTEALDRLFGAGGRNAALALDASYRQIKKLVTDLGAAIATEQERFNLEAGRFNARIGRLPISLVAGVAGLKPQAIFEGSGARRA